jgi:hypothetical protein
MAARCVQLPSQLRIRIPRLQSLDRPVREIMANPRIFDGEMFPSSPPEFAEKYANSNRCCPSSESGFLP